MRTETILVCDDCVSAIRHNDFSKLRSQYSLEVFERRKAAIIAGIDSYLPAHLSVHWSEQAFTCDRQCECCNDDLLGTRYICNVVTFN